MATLVLVLLVALAALAGGILIGRYYVPDDRGQRRAAGHGMAYMRAVNHLLSRDHDAAVAELRQVVRDDVADVEPYFALGALFRTRGEWERAIRVHQAIELREDQNPRVALRARYELGLDFRAAGMPRRATRAMEDCIAEDPEHEGALRALCGLYEDQERYSEAALAWERLERSDSAESERVVHLWAAAASSEAKSGEIDLARRALQAAQERDPEHPHVLVVAAEVAAAAGDTAAARDHWLAALAKAPALASFLAACLYEVELDAAASAPPESGQLPAGDEGIAELAARRTAAQLEQVADAVGAEPHLLLARAEFCSRFDAEAAGQIYAEAALRAADFLPARVAMARLALAGGETAAMEEELAALAGEHGALSWALAAVWRCAQCGARAPAFFWRCQSCHQWAKARRDVGRAAFDPSPEAPRERRAAGRKSSRPLLEQSSAAREQEGESDSLLERASSIITGVWRSVRREQPPDKR
jgi:lipopolysaccharide biosynthesis regulator YciM